jgi:hypothetical protein
MSESVSQGKDLSILENLDYTPSQPEIIHVLNDAVLTKRIEINDFQWKMSFKFDTQDNLIKLTPSP